MRLNELLIINQTYYTIVVSESGKHDNNREFGIHTRGFSSKQGISSIHSFDEIFIFHTIKHISYHQRNAHILHEEKLELDKKYKIFILTFF